MPAPKGSKNGQVAWFTNLTDEEKIVFSARIPISLRDRAKATFKHNESVSHFLVEAIELLIKERSR